MEGYSSLIMLLGMILLSTWWVIGISYGLITWVLSSDASFGTAVKNAVLMSAYVAALGGLLMVWGANGLNDHMNEVTSEQNQTVVPKLSGDDLLRHQYGEDVIIVGGE
jgi:hypothetical protein